MANAKTLPVSGGRGRPTPDLGSQPPGVVLIRLIRLTDWFVYHYDRGGRSYALELKAPDSLLAYTIILLIFMGYVVHVFWARLE